MARKTTSKSPNINSRYRFSKLGFFAFGITFSLVGAYILIKSEALPGIFPGLGSPKVALRASPTYATINKGNVITISINMDSQNQPVNAVQANLTYPSSKLEFVSIDSSQSPFEIQAQAAGGSGSVKIARGHIGALSGQKLIAKVNFKAINTGTATISFGEGSVIARSTDNSDILKETNNSIIRIR